MTTPAGCSVEDCFVVFWKIKNFSYCCEVIRSPEFSLDGHQYKIELSLCSLTGSSNYVTCQLRKAVNWRSVGFEDQISFLTCDGSPELLLKNATSVQKDIIFGKRRNAFLPEDTLTVRFRHPTSYKKGKIFISSQIGVNEKYFLWTFKDFCKGQDYTGIYAEQSELYGNIRLGLKSMCGNNPSEQFTIEITRSSGQKCYCVLKISVVGVDGKAVNEVRDEFVFEKTDGNKCQIRGFPLIIRKSKLLACENLPNDTLTLKCYFATSLGMATIGTSIIGYCENATALVKENDALSLRFHGKSHSGCATELQTDLKSILENGTLHDVSFHVGSEVIRAHKSILSARSPVFKAMFTKDMKEALDNTVEIEDFDLDTVRRLLLYMYTDTIPDYQWENVKNLYLAADKYQVLSLKEICVSFLKTNLAICNVSEALLLADLYQDGGLKTAALDFISEYDSEVFASEQWKELEKNNSSLGFQTMRDLFCNKRIKLN